ncbi:BlaI/MecI/CopY family transcriptional regulator [Aquisphaera insulae]|uniref:BlaI/MecI/CopY family transcriptional regulator n=1 Tax=Aquisphaera insulae TaxID=2712864 RepID=UPI0013EAF7E9|nr:BlaI/MecI/CopY family transcriptional regulator [Aquisphaera insulae]
MGEAGRELPELSPAQAEIMEIVWDRGEVSASDVREVLSAARPVARNTVRTLLERMEEKGWLRHREEGRTFLYAAVQPRKTTIGRKVREVVDTVCGGSAEALVAALLDDRGLSAGELMRIREMLAAARATRTKKGGS